jgi:hypothetical protein
MTWRFWADSEPRPATIPSSVVSARGPRPDPPGIHLCVDVRRLRIRCGLRHTAIPGQIAGSCAHKNIYLRKKDE